MKFKKYIYIAITFAACLACKKKEDEYISLPDLNGTLQVVGLEEFLAPGEPIRLTAKGLTHPEGGEIGYSWQILPSMSKSDTIDVFERNISDTLRTYTVYCTAFAEGYNSSTVITYTTTVESGPNGSIQGIDAYKTTIPNTTQYQVSVGNQTWMQNNFYGDPDNLANDPIGTPYRDAMITSDVLGKYYTFEEAKEICGTLGNEWSLPTKEDWEILEKHIKDNLSDNYGKTMAAAMMGNATFNSNLMWEYWPKVGEIKNGSGFSAIPTGYATFGESTNIFDGFYQYAAFWTSTETDDGSKAYYKYIYVDQPDMFTGIADKVSFGAAVRCIKKD